MAPTAFRISGTFFKGLGVSHLAPGNWAAHSSRSHLFISLTRDIRIINWTTKLLKPSRVSPTSSMLQNVLFSQAWS